MVVVVVAIVAAVAWAALCEGEAGCDVAATGEGGLEDEMPLMAVSESVSATIVVEGFLSLEGCSGEESAGLSSAEKSRADAIRGVRQGQIRYFCLKNSNTWEVCWMREDDVEKDVDVDGDGDGC